MKKILFANWKMNLSYKDSLKLAKGYQKKIKKSSHDLVVMPDFSALADISKILTKSAFKVGAQDVSPYNLGSCTGEVSALSLKQLGSKYVLVGHSERRQLFKESDELLRLKIEQSLLAGLVPVICVGETLGQKKTGKTQATIAKQLKTMLDGLVIDNDKAIIIAYEPIWAIGSGQSLSPLETEKVHVFIKGLLVDLIGQIPKVIYGGSVKSDNAQDFLEWPNVDGLLIGGASLDIVEFLKITQVN